MKALSLRGFGYRNLRDFELTPCDGVNIIYGGNANGKTNMIEALWLFTGNKSFRGAKESELVAFGRSGARIELRFNAFGRDQEARIDYGGTKRMFLNKVERKSPSELAEQFKAVIFSPLDIRLVSDSPAVRRHFLDTAIASVRPAFGKVLNNYHRAMQQRNVILRDAPYHSELLEMLDIFEEHLANYGARIVCNRRRYVNKLDGKAREIYAGLSKEREGLEIEYDCGGIEGDSEEEVRAELIKRLEQSRKADSERYVTSVGPHRDELVIKTGNELTRSFGSQGQKRSAALALKLAESELMSEVCGERPVVLLDDVMSELDSDRQDYILHHMEGKQVFITCCDVAPALRLVGGKCFEVKDGTIIEKG